MSTPHAEPDSRGQRVARAPRVVRWLRLSEELLTESCEVLNSLNVFPVPDADTGTNLLATVRVAAQAIAQDSGDDAGATLEKAATAALGSARGNSGTLFAVALAGMAVPLKGTPHLTMHTLVEALQRAESAARNALSDPTEGTMLTVLRVASQSAQGSWAQAQREAAEDGQPTERRVVLHGALEDLVTAAHAAVAMTEHQLESLHRAGVVDAGAVGLLWIFESLRSVVTDSEPRRDLMDELHGYTTGGAPAQSQPAQDGVEVMCTIELEPLGAATLRHELTQIGDSVIVAPTRRGDDPLARVPWRVHVHVQEQDHALALLQAAGEPEEVTVTSLCAQEHPEGHDHQH
ncbi:MAG: DAK2 domain-containing protein [Micrococcus sp.]|nr:DAK2 domain-containing protein [Micrococcus sp.]